MKTLILISILFILAHSLSAQKVIERPAFKGTTASYIKILKIELQDTATVIDFRVHYGPGLWIRVPNETWITDSNGGEKLFVKSAKGIKINEEHFTPENGVNDYTLYFPPIGKNVETIDYEEAQWKIFGIELVPQERFSIFPEPLLGNWLLADGSNEWVYGFYEDFVIYNGEIWKQVLINQKGDTYQLMLRKESKKETLFVKQQNGNLLIGPDEDNLQLFSKNETPNPKYVIAGDEEFSAPVFKSDSAFYCGFIKGYDPRMGATGMLYVNNILTQDQESYLITINQDGTFRTGFPMIYPQQVFVKIFSSFESIFCEPGKTTFQFNDFSTYHDEGGPKLLFMGETAKINSDLMAMKFIRFFDYQKMMDKILDMTPEEYKAFILDIEKAENEALKEFSKNNSVCKKALQIKQMQIAFNAQEKIISYNMFTESAYRTKNNVPQDQREIPLERVELKPEYYDFINAADLNNPLSLLSGGEYNTLINRIRFADVVRPKTVDMKIKPEDYFKEFELNNIELTEKEKELINKLGEYNTPEKRNELYNQDSVFVSNFLSANREIISNVGRKVYTNYMKEYQNERMEEYFGLTKGLAFDIMFAQTKCGTLKSGFKPFTETEKTEIKTEIDDEFIASYVLEMSAKMELEVEAKKQSFQNKTGFVINKTPDAKGNDLFDTIMKKYKGNVVFIDFWATWCGPCREGMKNMKPLKEELKEKEMKFVYFTNPTSPKDTWELLIPEIDGEHYYLTQDEWNIMSARFKVSGIPHYVLVDKTGKVVKDKIYFASPNIDLKKMIEEYL
jgi:thiol-disulfide isomerase/thioredoxin